MRLDTTMTQRMDQRMILAPRMIQSMEILQLPIMALQERIQQELQENPVLELKEANKDDTLPEENYDGVAEANGKDPNDPRTELVIDANGNGEEDLHRLERSNQHWADHFNEDHSRVSSNRVDEEGDRRHDFEQNMPSRPQSLQDYLGEQLSFVEAPPDLMRLVKFVITHIDDRGFLATTLEEGGKGYDAPVTPEQGEESLAGVQRLNPRGVAGDLSECLPLQLTPETPHREVVRVLIQNHLEDITHNRLPLIQKKTGFDLHTIGEAIDALKHLNPRPGAQFTAENIPYVVP